MFDCSWRKPIRLVLSAKIAPHIVSFDLSAGNSYGDYAYSDLTTPKLPALRNLRLSFYTDFATSESSDEEDKFSLIPAALFHAGVPQLRSVTLDNICFGADKRAVGKIFAFTNVTTANFPNLDLHYMHNLGLYLPNVVYLTVGPTLAHDRIDIREILRMGSDKTNATSPLDYLRDKTIIPFGTSLKFLHICCSDFERQFGPRRDLNHYIRILAQVTRGLAPHLRVLSFDALDDTYEGVASADFIDELAGACGPGSTTSFAINVANDVRLDAQCEIRGLDLTMDAIRDGISIIRLNIALDCSTSCKGKDDDHCFWPKLFAALQQRSQNVTFAMPKALLTAQNKSLAKVLDNLRCSLPSAAFKFTDAESTSVRPVSPELA